MCSMPEAAITRGEQRAAQQRRADAVTLPRLFDADRGLGLARKAQAERPQFGGAAHHAIDEKAMHDGIERGGEIDVFADEIVRHAAAEPAAPAVADRDASMCSRYLSVSPIHNLRITPPSGRTSCIQGLLTFVVD